MGRFIRRTRFKTLVLNDQVPHPVLDESPYARRVKFIADDTTRDVLIAYRQGDFQSDSYVRLPALSSHEMILAADSRLWCLRRDQNGTALSVEWCYVDDGSGRPLPDEED
jgi:hypothetical protein